MPTVFVVSEDTALRESACELMATAGLDAEATMSLESWLAAVPPQRPGCLVLDARERDFREPGQLERFAAICAVRPVLLLIDRGDVPIAVLALKRGAVDVLEKPWRAESLLDRIRQVAALRT
ncbi:MAG TPA: hypothetical protein PLE54_19470 [Burkholderiaceae bacterium]|nr:hypothetical protein [Burkholderiaceae bacterium]